MHLLNLPPRDIAWTPDVLRSVNRLYEDRSATALLQWGFDTFGDGIALSTAFGPSGIVLMHLVSRMRPGTTVFYLDTGLFFPETYALRDQLADQLGLTFTRVAPELTVEEQAAQHGPALWERQPDQCCFLRKVLPLRRFLGTRKAWITGIRRDQSPTRARTRLVDWDAANGLVKLNPLAGWTAEDVWGYLLLHDLPYNRLHDEGYPSIGCMPCTQPVAPGEPERAGRWRGHGKLECGIHLRPTGSE